MFRIRENEHVPAYRDGRDKYRGTFGTQRQLRGPPRSPRGYEEDVGNQIVEFPLRVANTGTDVALFSSNNEKKCADRSFDAQARSRPTHTYQTPLTRRHVR